MSLNPKKKWITGAIKKEGALTDYVRRKYGDDGFTERGTIKMSILHELIRDPDVTMTTRRRAQLALNLRTLDASKRLPEKRIKPKRRK